MSDADNDFLKLATLFLESVTSELDPFTSKDGIIATEGDSVALYTPDYIQFAKYGRGPGKLPPLDPILDWVKSRGIIFDGLDEEGTAKAIMYGIGKNGTVRYVPDAPNALEEAIGKNLSSYVELTNQLLMVTLSDGIYTTKYVPDRLEKFEI